MSSPPPDRWRGEWRDAFAPYLALAAVLLALVLRVATGAGVAYGAGTPGSHHVEDVNVAGLVVEFGGGQVAYALVPFTEPAISGFELLNRSGLSLLSVEFGGLGQGICAIEETGCDLGACRARLCQTGDPDSAFWQYAQGSDDGSWSPSPLGASGSQVTDGGIDAWSWGSAPPDPGQVTLDDIAARTGVELAALRTGERTEPVLVTTGGDQDEATAGRDGILAAAIVGGVVILGGLALRRQRRGATT
jgi:hypothetical protein